MRLSAFVIFVYGFTRLGRTPSVLDVAAALVLLAVALVILYSLSMTRSYSSGASFIGPGTFRRCVAMRR